MNGLPVLSFMKMSLDAEMFFQPSLLFRLYRNEDPLTVTDLSIQLEVPKNTHLLSLQTGDNSSPEPGCDRLDSWLSAQLPEISRSRVQKIIKDGGVRLNGEVCCLKKSPLKPGDRLEIQIPAAKPLEIESEEIPLDILYEDDALLICLLYTSDAADD